MPTNGKRVMLSGIQPTGHLMIGNYVGAIQNWVKLQDEYKCFFVLVDMHAITVWHDPQAFRERCYQFIALYIACGVDPEKNAIFVQSHIPGHAQLAWILNCFTSVGELNRMTQYKEKSARYSSNVNAGLFDYPVLMAADILLYRSDVVPVGDDQKQHVELTRRIAKRVNKAFGQIFTVPEPFILPVGSRLMSLQDPTSKMSKSDANPDNYIALLDAPDTVRSKIRKAVTDSGAAVVFEAGKPGISNLMTLYSAITGDPIPAIQARYIGHGYGRFKDDLADALIDSLKPIQQRYGEICNDRDGLMKLLQDGAERAQAQSESTLKKVHEALVFIVPLKS